MNKLERLWNIDSSKTVKDDSVNNDISDSCTKWNVVEPPKREFVHVMSKENVQHDLMKHYFMKRLLTTGRQLEARYNDRTNDNKEQEDDINDMETDADDPEDVDDTRQELDANAKRLMTTLLKQYKAEFEV